MTYGQRQRREERRLQRAADARQAWYDSLTPEERAAFDEKARIAKAQLLASLERTQSEG